MLCNTLVESYVPDPGTVPIKVILFRIVLSLYSVARTEGSVLPEVTVLPG